MNQCYECKTEMAIASDFGGNVAGKDYCDECYSELFTWCHECQEAIPSSTVCEICGMDVNIDEL